MGILRLAWRNIWRNTRRTAVTVAAMALSLAVTIVYAAMVEGYMVTMERDALDAEMGVAQVFAQGYQDRPSIYSVMEDAPAVVDRLRAAGLPAAARLLGGGLMAAGESSAGVQLRGIDVAAEQDVLSVAGMVKEGRWLDAAHPNGVVLGLRLARTLGVTVGDEVVMLSQATDGSIANSLGVVRGVLATVSEPTDRAGVFMTAAAFREFFQLEKGAHQIIVKRPDVVDLPALEAHIQAAAPGHQVMTWRALVPVMATMMDSVGGLMAFLMFIINVAIAIVILNAMLMAVFERIKEFGVLKALGVAPLQVLAIIYAESFLQVGVALIVGVLAAAGPLAYLVTVGVNMGALAGVGAMGTSMVSQWHAVASVRGVVTPVGMMVWVVLVAVLYPAVKAAVIEPVTAMHHR